MASNFDVDKWFSKLKDDNRFSLTRRTKDGKTVFYVAKGFVLNYGLLANESEKRAVRSRLMVAFKGKPFQDKYRGYGFEKFTDKTLKDFLDSQETYRGRTVVKKSTTAKKHIEALPLKIIKSSDITNLLLVKIITLMILILFWNYKKQKL